MLNNYSMGLMTWQEYADALSENCVAFLPCGALEQHGPHLPMATDAIFAEAMATNTAQRLAKQMKTLVLPTLGYGYKSQARSGGGQTFVGTTSLDGATLTHTVLDIIRELARHGLQRLVIVDGHYENQWFITEAIELAMRELAYGKQTMQVLRCEYWDYCPQAVLDEIFAGDFPGMDLEHAALIETSMMLALHPEWVRTDKIPANDQAHFVQHDHYPQDGSGVPASGVLAPAGNASADKGRRIIDATTEHMAQAFQQAFVAGEG